MFCDIHNHVLPGVDDGATSIEHSMRMLKQAQTAGIDTICATPHIHGDVADVEKFVAFDAALSSLKTAATAEGIHIELKRGCEIYFTSEFANVAKLSAFAYPTPSQFVLVELPPTEAPPWFADLCFSLSLSGRQVLLAHPERNIALMRNPATLLRYIQTGIKLQLTAGSISGQYGKSIRQFALRILRLGACAIVASDAHNTSSRPFSQMPDAYRETEQLLGTAIAIQLFDTNPRAILSGELLHTEAMNADLEELLLGLEKKRRFFVF